MTHYKTMVVFQGKTNLPEDRFVNTFHFEKVGQLGVDDEDVDHIASCLELLYDAPNVTAGFSIASRMPTDVLSATVEFRTYDQGEPEPRLPHIRTTTMTFGGGSPLPTEVALCSSFHGDRNIPKERGRVYLGPWLGIAASTGPAGKGSIPNDVLRAAIADNFDGFQAAVLARPDLFWSVFSPTRAEEHPSFSGLTHVTGGWVDNAWDTQRRRGTDATARTVWGSAVAP